MKRYTDDALARAIYRTAAGRMQAAGREMPCSEAAFSVLTAASPEGVRYQDMAELNNADFLETAFLLLLGRPLDDTTRKAWQGNLALPETDFRILTLKTIVQSGEYANRRTPLTGCPFPLAEDEPQGNLLISAAAMPERLVKMYQALPRPMQKLAKKIAGKE